MNVLPDEQVVTPADDKKFSQADMDAAVEGRLAREKAQHETELENLRTEAQRQVAAARGISGSAEKVLDDQRAQMEKDATQLRMLEETYFGSGPGCGARSQKLKTENPKEYARLKGLHLSLRGWDRKPAPNQFLHKV